MFSLNSLFTKYLPLFVLALICQVETHAQTKDDIYNKAISPIQGQDLLGAIPLLNAAITEAEKDSSIDVYLKMRLYFSRVNALSRLGQPQLAEQDYAEILQQGQTLQDSKSISLMANAAMLLGFSYEAQSKNSSKAASIYTKAIDLWGARTELEIARPMIAIYWRYGLLVQRFYADTTLQLYNRAITQYANLTEPIFVRALLEVMLAKSDLLLQLDRVDEGLASLDDIQSKYGNQTAPQIVSMLAKSQRIKAVFFYDKLKRIDESHSLLRSSLAQWDLRPEVPIRLEMAYVIGQLGYQARAESAKDNALVLFENLLQRATQIANKPLVLEAKFNIAAILLSQEKYNESLDACNQFLETYEKETDSISQYWLARTMQTKGSVLQSLQRFPDAIQTYDALMMRFQNSSVPRVSMLVDQAAESKKIAVQNDLLLKRGGRPLR
jgi:hypothetical protein